MIGTPHPTCVATLLAAVAALALAAPALADESGGETLSIQPIEPVDSTPVSEPTVTDTSTTTQQGTDTQTSTAVEQVVIGSSQSTAVSTTTIAGNNEPPLELYGLDSVRRTARGISLRVSCNDSCVVSGRIAMSINSGKRRKRWRIVCAARTLDAQQKTTITFTLPRSALRLLGKRSAVGTLTVQALDDEGDTVQSQQPFILRG